MWRQFAECSGSLPTGWNDIDEGGEIYAPFRPDMYCGGSSYDIITYQLGLDIPQVNVASVEGAEVSGDEQFVGSPGPAPESVLDLEPDSPNSCRSTGGSAGASGVRRGF